MKSLLKNRQTIPHCLQFWGCALLGILLHSPHFSYSQCNNSTLFPASPVVASAFNDTVVVSNNSNAGQYYQVKNLALNQTYVFAGKAGDFITIRNIYSNAVLGSGAAPYTYVVGSGPDVVNVHINLVNPACGSDAVPRTTTVACVTCSQQPPKTGISKAIPQATLDLGGELKLGNAARPPQAGMIRWNPDSQDFEGYNGTSWLSLTKSNTAAGQWGQASAATVEESGRFGQTSGAGRYYSVSTSGDYTIIGAAEDTIGANYRQGAAYVFYKSGTTWTLQATLTASDGAAYDGFGNSVSISGDYAMIGAPYKNGGTFGPNGAAYIFVRNGTSWVQQAKLTASDGGNSDGFGTSVGISGDYAVAGAPSHTIGLNSQQGAAYVFARNGSLWTQQAKLTASDAASYDYFGTSTSISGDYVIAGARGDDVGANTDQGSSYVFVRNGTSWTQQAKLTATTGAKDDYFGISVSISGTYAAIGAMGRDNGAIANQGALYIFLRNGTAWTQQAVLTTSDAAANDFFGFSVNINGDYVVAGALRYEYDNLNSVYKSNQGSAYIFNRFGTGWIQQGKFIASDGGQNDFFAASVSVSGDYTTISCRRNIYFFRKN